MNKTLLRDCEHMEQIMQQTAPRCDIWQDRFIYWIAVAIMMMLATSCASLERDMKDLKSDFGRGLDRIVTVYNADGEVLKTYEGKIDVASNDSGVVKFELNGQRIMYYNCFVEVIEKVD